MKAAFFGFLVCLAGYGAYTSVVDYGKVWPAVVIGLLMYTPAGVMTARVSCLADKWLNQSSGYTGGDVAVCTVFWPLLVFFGGIALIALGVGRAVKRVGLAALIGKAAKGLVAYVNS